MSVRLRLKHTGTRNAKCYRIVVMDQRMSRDGRAIEEIGFYNPRSKVETVKLDRAAGVIKSDFFDGTAVAAHTLIHDDDAKAVGIAGAGVLQSDSD